MKKIYIDLDTGRKIADSLPELDTMLKKPERIGAFIVPFWENFGTIAEYSRAERVAIW
jgi:hypothetical protein